MDFHGWWIFFSGCFLFFFLSPLQVCMQPRAVSVRQSTPYLGSFHFLSKEVAEVCTESTPPLTNLWAISPTISLPTEVEEAWAFSYCCKHLPRRCGLLRLTVSTKLGGSQAAPSSSWSSPMAPPALVAVGGGLHDTKQHRNFLIFFLRNLISHF